MAIEFTAETVARDAYSAAALVAMGHQLLRVEALPPRHEGTGRIKLRFIFGPEAQADLFAYLDRQPVVMALRDFIGAMDFVFDEGRRVRMEIESGGGHECGSAA